MNEQLLKTPLKILVKLFEDMEKANIPYCHFKSNEHLAEAMYGDTDIDLLISKEHAPVCEKLLIKLNYKRFKSQPWSEYPGIEDWIGFDEPSGRIVHIHLHYQLLTGARFIKEQHLPWEGLILDTTIRDTEFNIPIINPSLELVLLATRVSLKTSYYQLFKYKITGKLLPNNIQDEFDFLNKKADPEKVKQYAIVFFGEEDGCRIFNWIIKGLINHKSAIRATRKIIKKHYSEYQRITSIRLNYLRLTNFCKLVLRGFRKRLNLQHQRGKRPHSGGAIIAVIGCDGSGKSTITNELIRWLSWKIDVQRIYLGSGDGHVGIPVKVMKYLFKTVGGRRQKQNFEKSTKNLTDKNNPNKLKKIVRAFFALLVSIDRYKKVKQINKDRLNGRVIVTDRYPQNEFSGVNDGPHLKLTGNRTLIERWTARAEINKYNRMAKVLPNIVIRLKVPAQIALERKKYENEAILRKKVMVIDKLTYNGARIIDVDATRPLADVEKEVKKIVWKML